MDRRRAVRYATGKHDAGGYDTRMPRLRPTSHRLLAAILIPILAFLALGAWSLSSPAGSSPDDDFHLASIWCGLGERPGLCENPEGDPVKRFVPAPVQQATCFAFHPEESAACWRSEATGMVEVDRANADGLYPPVFYAAMSAFASPNVAASVMAMKLFNCAFAVGVLTLTFFVLPRRLRPALLVSVVATAMPLGMFIYGSTNPSTWAFLSAAIVWITALGALQTVGRQRIVLLALMLFGVVIGAGARADSAVYAVFAVLLAVLLGWRIRREQIPALVVAALAITISVAFYLSAWQGSSIVGGLDTERGPLSAAQHLGNLLAAPSLWMGALGGWGLGWLDTPMPAAVSVLAGAVFWGAIFIGLRRADLRRGIAVSVAIAAMWLVPVVLLGQSRMMVGELIQPRYLIPLMIIAVGVASYRWDAARAWSGMRLILAGAALSIANVVALHINIQRYTTGTDRLSTDPGRDAEWWWAHAPSPMAVWIVGSLALTGVFIALWFVVHRGEESSISDDDGRSLDTPGSPLDAGGAATSTAAAVDQAAVRPAT